MRLHRRIIRLQYKNGQLLGNVRGGVPGVAVCSVLSITRTG